MSSPDAPLTVALLGAGLFAGSAHLPALLAEPGLFQLAGVWSRSAQSAAPLAAQAGCPALDGEAGLQALLDSAELDAVVVCLPLDVQPLFVLRALEAGKHVLSEKPVAADVGTARHMAQLHASGHAGLRWSVAENYRYEPGLQAGALAAKRVGKLGSLQMTVQSPMSPENKYFHTAWRSSPSWQGGLFLDSGVHFVAAMRMAAGSAVVAVSALMSHRANWLPGPDTLAAVVEFESGLHGTLNISFASAHRKFLLEVVGSEGTVEIERAVVDSKHGYVVSTRKFEPEKDNKLVSEEIEHYPFGGVPAEFRAWALGCADPESQDCNSPEQAFDDVAFISACLESGAQGGQRVCVERLVT